MKMKNRGQLIVAISLLLLTSFLWAGYAQAGASATVSWVAPTTNQDGSTPVDVTGYRVYYSTSSTLWPNVSGTCLVQSGDSKDVTGGATTSYNIVNILSPGSTYYFTVAAIDGDNNISRCATIPGGGATQVSKRVSYTADINTYQTSSQKVDIYDFNLFFQNFGSTTPGNVADMNKDGEVDIFDYNFIFEDFGKSFI